MVLFLYNINQVKHENSTCVQASLKLRSGKFLMCFLRLGFLSFLTTVFELVVCPRPICKTRKDSARHITYDYDVILCIYN